MTRTKIVGIASFVVKYQTSNIGKNASTLHAARTNGKTVETVISQYTTCQVSDLLFRFIRFDDFESGPGLPLSFFYPNRPHLNPLSNRY